MVPLTFYLLRNCRKWCERSEVNVKMPELLRRSRSVATIFYSIFGFLKKKKKKKKVFALAKSFYFPFLCRYPGKK